jgi:hypothetical protein
MRIIQAGTRTMGVVVWRFEGLEAARPATREGEPMGVSNQPVEHGIAKCVFADHPVPVFKSAAG